jgi:glyoxylase-like metal-dependent hydrolase (beta-lactamase superfamily II)
VERVDGTLANAYVISLGEKKVLVDAGTEGSGRKIVDFFTRNGTRPDCVLITHYHMDHVGGLKLVYDMFRPAIYAPGVEVPVIQGREKMKPAPGLLPRLVARFSRGKPVEDVRDVSTLLLEGLKVVETPGHTPGSTSFLLERERLIFVGDAISTAGGRASVNRMFTYDHAKALQSFEKVMGMRPITILPGHGDPLTI